jgi:hypothetical protein
MGVAPSKQTNETNQRKTFFWALALVRYPPGPHSLVAGGTVSLVSRAGPGVNMTGLYMYIESDVRYLLHVHDDRR